MKKIWDMLRHHVKEDFHRGAYFYLLLFLSLSISLNYYFDFEDSYVDRVPEVWRIPAKFLWLALPYFTACFIILPFYNKNRVFNKASFWIPALFILTCLAFDSGFPVYEWLIKENFNYKLHLWLSRITRDFLNIPFVLIPAWIYYRLKGEHSSFYGLTAPFDPKPYLMLLLVMVPLLYVASLMENFSSFYPMYKYSLADDYLNVSENWLIFIYELSYAWNFVSVEFIFRGFLVIGMAHVLGRQAILPMVALYCFYHFGKPAGEAISAIIGGYFLGVIAFETKSILGGVILHIGVALIMELFGFFL